MRIVVAILVAIAALWVGGMVLKLALGILNMVLPLLLLAGVAYLVYSIVAKKPLGGGRRTLP